MAKLTKREQRVIKAFENCIMHGEITTDYAVMLIEDNARYGWMSNEAKEEIYEWISAYEEAKRIEEEEEAKNQIPVEEEPVEDGPIEEEQSGIESDAADPIM